MQLRPSDIIRLNFSSFLLSQSCNKRESFMKADSSVSGDKICSPYGSNLLLFELEKHQKSQYRSSSLVAKGVPRALNACQSNDEGEDDIKSNSLFQFAHVLLGIITKQYYVGNGFTIGMGADLILTENIAVPNVASGCIPRNAYSKSYMTLT